MSSIFGGNTPWTYEQLQNKRKIAERLRPRGMPSNVGEGIAAVGNALLSRSLERHADRREAEIRDTFRDQFANRGNATPDDLIGMYDSPVAGDAQKRVIEALLNGVPGFRRGTRNAPGGMAVVGEEGPEVVYLPKGSEVVPNPMTVAGNAPMTPDARLPEGFAAGGHLNQIGSNFEDDKQTQVADMSDIEPSGTGERNNLHSAARSFQGFMKSLQDYEELFNDGGATVWPGERKDTLATAHRDLQMQMKELYNLGVLNGPDLELMEQILINPTTLGGNLMDAFGIADMETRIPSNIENVRRMMINRTTPALQQLNIDPQSLMPGGGDLSGMTDEQLLQLLNGGS